MKTLVLFIAIVVVAGSIEPVINKTIKKLDEKTIEVTTVTTSTVVAELDKAELQTQLDHIPRDRVKVQQRYDAEMAAIDEREAELIEFLAAFK